MTSLISGIFTSFRFLILKTNNVDIKVNSLFCIQWYNFHMVNSFEHNSNSFAVWLGNRIWLPSFAILSAVKDGSPFWAKIPFWICTYTSVSRNSTIFAQASFFIHLLLPRSWLLLHEFINWLLNFYLIRIFIRLSVIRLRSLSDRLILFFVATKDFRRSFPERPPLLSKGYFRFFRIEYKYTAKMIRTAPIINNFILQSLKSQSEIEYINDTYVNLNLCPNWSQ